MGKLLKRIKNNIKKKNPMAGWKTGKETEAVVLKPDEKGPEFVVGNPSPEPRTDVTREDMRPLLDAEAKREAEEQKAAEELNPANIMAKALANNEATSGYITEEPPSMGDFKKLEENQ